MATILFLLMLLLAGGLAIPSVLVFVTTILPPRKVSSISVHMLFTRIDYRIADPVQDYLGSIEIRHLPIFAGIGCLAIAGLLWSFFPIL